MGMARPPEGSRKSDEQESETQEQDACQVEDEADEYEVSSGGANAKREQG